MELDQKYLFMAFRYALGRKTYVASYVAEEVIKKWFELEPQYRTRIQYEIRTAIEIGDAGMDMDVEEWEKVLRLEP